MVYLELLARCPEAEDRYGTADLAALKTSEEVASITNITKESEDKTVQLSRFDGSAKVEFTQWPTAEKAREDAREGPTTVKITVKKTMEDTQDNLVELFHTLLHKFKRHTFNINQQYSYCRELKKNLSKEEAVIHIDFSENYTCKYSSEIQAVHFGSSHQQATLHTGVLYIGGEK